MMAIERSAERDAALTAMLPLVEQRGWTVATLCMAAGPDADLLFPGGPAEMVEAYCDLADRWMEEDVAAFSMAGMRVPDRVRLVIAMRFKRNEADKGAVRRGLGLLALPGQGMRTARITARTVDSIWHAAGDASVDFSWYTKRAILAGVYGQTLLYWLRDTSDGSEDTLAFLDRRLAGVGRIGRARRRLRGLLPGGAAEAA